MENKKPVAWIVREEDEGSTIVIFHHHGLAARRIGAQTLSTEFEYVECNRAKELDDYADKGRVPPIELIKNGWWFECRTCGCRVDSDEYNYDEEKPIPLTEVIEYGDEVFCSQACEEVQQAAIMRQNDRFEEFKSKVLLTRPDLYFTEWKGEWPWITMTGEFKFDGAKFGGSVRDDGEGLKWTVAEGDMDAWKYYESKRIQIKKQERV